MLEANKEQEALELLSKLPIAGGSGGGESHYLLGAMYYSMGKTNDAKRVLAIARTKEPQSARIAAYLGIVQLSDGETAVAENSFQAALVLNSAETLALIGMGGIRYQQQRWSDVIVYLEKSRTANPDTLFLLCDSYYRAGKPDEALLLEVIGLGRTVNLTLKLETLVSLHQRIDRTRSMTEGSVPRNTRHGHVCDKARLDPVTVLAADLACRVNDTRQCPPTMLLQSSRHQPRMSFLSLHPWTRCRVAVALVEQN